MQTLLPQLARLCRTTPRTDAELLDQFLVRRDEAAFTLLVQRHGPMVMGVCRRLLGDHGEAEDAFQATFLVLVRKAMSLVGQPTLAPWLHGVAHRTALKARCLLHKRNARQEPLQMEPVAKHSPDPEDWEWRCLLEEEVQRLPDKYRVPVVLCYLAGQTKTAAAKRLGVPEGTVSSRLARVREKLLRRLSNRGVALTGTALASLLLPCPVSAQLLQATTAIAWDTLYGLPLSVSPIVTALSQGVLRAMVLGKYRLSGVAVFFLLLCGLGWGLNWQPRSPMPEPPPQPAAAKPAEDQGRIEGRITAADTGKPVAGATVKVLVQGVPQEKMLVTAKTDAEGRYSIAVPLGDARLWGILSPAGYYTQDESSWAQILTTADKPKVTRDFVLQTGAPWHLRLEGADLPKDPLLYSATPDPDRETMRTGETIMVTSNEQGHAVVSLPPSGGRYRVGSYLGKTWANYEMAPINLEIDRAFDPRQVVGTPEQLTDRKAMRLKDAAGRTALVDGAEISVEKGQAVLRIKVKPLANTSAFTLRGRVVDEAGAPVVNALATVSFSSKGGGAMSQFDARTDARGQYELTLQLPASVIRPDSQICMMVIKNGYNGAPTEKLSLVETQKAGSGDFGTVVLKPGRTLRGTVVDENGLPVQGAVVTNMTNYFLYGHLRCRTDAAGKFTMPDLAWGHQEVSANWGERFGQVKFVFDEQHQECTIAVRLIPKSGIRESVSPAPRRQKAATPPVAFDVGWDLTPPLKQPRYQKEPKYALLVFGPKREERVWLVLDGSTLYVDKNGNGDLTEPGEKLEPNNPKDGSNRFAGSGSHTHFDVFEFTVQAGTGGTSKFKLQCWVRAENYVPKSDLEKEWHVKWQKLRYENGTLWRQGGRGQGQTPLMFMPKPADAHVCALDGPLTFAVKLPQYTVLKRGEAGSDLAFHIVTLGRPHRESDHPFHNPLATTEVPEGAHLEVEIEFPVKGAGVPPLRRKFLLKARC